MVNGRKVFADRNVIFKFLSVIILSLIFVAMVALLPWREVRADKSADYASFASEMEDWNISDWSAVETQTDKSDALTIWLDSVGIDTGSLVVKRICDSDVSGSTRLAYLRTLVLNNAYPAWVAKNAFELACESFNADRNLEDGVAVMQNYYAFSTYIDNLFAEDGLVNQIVSGNDTFGDKYGCNGSGAKLTLPTVTLAGYNNGNESPLSREYLKALACNLIDTNVGSWKDASMVQILFGSAADFRIKIFDSAQKLLIDFYYAPNPSDTTYGTLEVLECGENVEYIRHQGTLGPTITLNVDGKVKTVKISIERNSETKEYISVDIGENDNSNAIAGCSLTYEKVETLSNYIDAAYTAIDASTLDELVGVYNAQTALLNEKRGEIVDAAVFYLTTLYNDFADWYDGNDWEDMQNIIADAEAELKGFSTTGDFNTFIKKFNDAVNQLKLYIMLDEQFRAAYASILIEDYKYTDAEFALAAAALDEYSGYAAVIKNALSGEFNILKNNYRISVIADLKEKANEIYCANEKRCSTVKARAFYDILSKYIDNINTAANSGKYTKIVTLKGECENALNEFKFTSISTLTADGIIVTADSACLDEENTLKFGISGAEENEVLNKAKRRTKYNDSIRFLSSLEQYSIEILDENGKSIDYDYETVFSVKIYVSNDILELVKTGKLDLDDLYIVFIDADGKLEIHELTLYIDGKAYSEGMKISSDGVEEVYIMFSTNHFSTYYLMGDDMAASSRLNKLLGGVGALLADTEMLSQIALIAGIVLGILLVAFLVCVFISAFKKYKITYVCNGGTKVAKGKFRYGSKIVQATTEREEYIFAGWYIDSTLCYKFNRTYMPRVNVTLYAKWIEKPVENDEGEVVDILADYYDRLRNKVLSSKKEVDENAVDFVESVTLAKMIMTDGQIELYLANGVGYIKEDEGKLFKTEDEDRFDKLIVSDEQTFNAAVAAIDKMMAANSLKAVEPDNALQPTTSEERVKGMAYIVKNEKIVPDGKWIDELRKKVAGYSVFDEKAENGKTVAEIYNSENLEFFFNGDFEKYSDFCIESNIEDVPVEFEIKTAGDMCVAVELVGYVMEQNGLKEDEDGYRKLEEVEIKEDEALGLRYKYIIQGKAGCAEDWFSAMRANITAYNLSLNDEDDFDDELNGKLIAKLSKNENDVALSLAIDKEIEGCEKDDIGVVYTIDSDEKLPVAKDLVAELMSGFGFEKDENAEAEVEAIDENTLAYRIKIVADVEFSLRKCFNRLRDKAKSYALFTDEDAEVDKTLDGKVLMHIKLKEDCVEVDLIDEQLQVTNKAECRIARDKIVEILSSNGFEPDADYVAGEDSEGDAFSYRIKFN